MATTVDDLSPVSKCACMKDCIDQETTKNDCSLTFSNQSTVQLKIIIPREEQVDEGQEEDEKQDKVDKSSGESTRASDGESNDEQQCLSVTGDDCTKNSETCTIHRRFGTLTDVSNDREDNPGEKVTGNATEQATRDVLIKCEEATSPKQSNVHESSKNCKSESYFDPETCIKATIESILNLLDSAPVTTSGISDRSNFAATALSKIDSPRTFETSPSLVPFAESSCLSFYPTSPGVDLNNNDILNLDSVCDTKNKHFYQETEDTTLSDYSCPPRLIPLGSPFVAKLSESDIESEIESNTSIEEEPITPTQVEGESSHGTPRKDDEDTCLEEQTIEESIKAEESEESEGEFEVDCILDRKFVRQSQQRYYLVKWKGYDIVDATWEPAANLFKCREAIDQFERKKAKLKRARYRTKMNEKLRTKRKRD